MSNLYERLERQGQNYVGHTLEASGTQLLTETHKDHESQWLSRKKIKQTS